jgi:hypothetical protein
MLPIAGRDLQDVRTPCQLGFLNRSAAGVGLIDEMVEVVGSE